MLNKIKNIFEKENKNSINSNTLIENYNPFVLNQNTKFVRKEIFRILDLKDELLDPKLSREEIFSIYWNVFKSKDSLIFESLNLKGNLFIINSNMIGREFAKTTSFNIKYKGESKEGLFEIVNGEGYFILESIHDEKKIIIVKVKKKNLILIPKEYSFTIINSKKDENLICFSLMGKNTIFEKKVLKKYNGTGVFYTINGFVKNKNFNFLYKLDKFEGDYIFENNFDKKSSLYDEFVKFPEKFSFLK